MVETHPFLGEVCSSIESGLWVIGAVSEQTFPVRWTLSERTVDSVVREQRRGCCEHASSQILSRNNVENWGHFYRYTFLPKPSFQAPYSWFFPEGFLWISHPIFLGQRFFPASLTLCKRHRCSLLLSDEYIYEGQYSGSRALWWQWARQLHWAFANESLLLMVSYQLISASAVLQMPFFPNTDFSLELQDNSISQPRCVAFLRPVWLPLDRSRFSGAQEIWVLGEPWGLKLWDCKNKFKSLPGKKKQLGNCWHMFSWEFVVGY